METATVVAPNPLEQLEKAGFQVIQVQGADTVSVRKPDCLQFLKRDAAGAWVPSGPPCVVIAGLNYRLEDRGYQKFWYAEGKRLPVRKPDLEALHRFDEEIRAILGLKSLYHESLGTTSARSVYDRLEGRPDKEP